MTWVSARELDEDDGITTMMMLSVAVFIDIWIDFYCECEGLV